MPASGIHHEEVVYLQFGGSTSGYARPTVALIATTRLESNTSPSRSVVKTRSMTRTHDCTRINESGH
jgi:hypothetical protein